MAEKSKAPRNRSLVLSNDELELYRKKFLKIDSKVSLEDVINKTICQDLFELLPFLPENSVDLIFIDPPYNNRRKFRSNEYKPLTISQYSEWLESFIEPLSKVLKNSGSLYLCGDWRSSTSIHLVLDKYFTVLNRITWEREKGRGAKQNWKNNSEDIWFCVKSNDYFFNVEAVKLKRKVIAPYKLNGKPKDWLKEDLGNYRLTHPSNIWTDISIPFWSMPENTEHPTQKPEKLLAKIILASSKPGDIVLDPFAGSGTTQTTAKKLGRKFIGIEIDEYYAALGEKRLYLAETQNSIQGFDGKYFWERNSLPELNK